MHTHSLSFSHIPRNKYTLGFSGSELSRRQEGFIQVIGMVGVDGGRWTQVEGGGTEGRLLWRWEAAGKMLGALRAGL